MKGRVGSNGDVIVKVFDAIFSVANNGHAAVCTMQSDLVGSSGVENDVVKSK